MKPSAVAVMIASIVLDADELMRAKEVICCESAAKREACEQAAGKYGQSDLAQLVFLAYDSWPNDTVDWATQIVNRQKPEGQVK